MSDKRQQLSILNPWASGSGQVSRSTERLSKIDEWIDWEPLYAVGRRMDKTGPRGGQPRKPERWMIRGLFLQHLYQLSDPQLEDHLIDRLSFRRFAGLPLDQKVPDFIPNPRERFREFLAAEGSIEERFAQITGQLEAKELILRGGTMGEASIIESAGRPLSDQKRQELNQIPIIPNRYGCRFDQERRRVVFWLQRPYRGGRGQQAHSHPVFYQSLPA